MGFILTSPALSSKFYSSYCDGLWDRRSIATQLLFCRVLFLWFVQKSIQHSYVVPICFDRVQVVQLWTPAYGQAKAGQPTRTYIQQLCEDTGCSPEDLPEAVNDKEKWRERVRDIHASGMTWWWWLIYFIRKIRFSYGCWPNNNHSYLFLCIYWHHSQ